MKISRTSNAGKKFGFLTATGIKMTKPSTNRQKALHEFECVCGIRQFKDWGSVKTGHAKSCGCMKTGYRIDDGSASPGRDLQVWALKLFAKAV